MLLRTGLDFRPRDLDALIAGVKQAGDERLILSDIGSLPPHQDNRVVACEFKTFHEARRGSILAHVDTAIFSPSGGWGAICNPEYTILAGAAVFMTKFLNVAGGKELLREDFLEYVARGIDVSRAFGEELLSEVGWA